MNPVQKYKPISELIDLSGKKAIVTGGATGIGNAISYRLAESGAAVAIADINIEEAEKTSLSLNEQGYQSIAVKCDVSDESNVKDMVQAVIDRIGGVDILVNNAGIFPQIPLEEMTGSEFDQIISINLKGTFLCSREVSQYIIKQRQFGCIINLASIDSMHPSSKGLSAYDASKGGVLTLTKSMALELGKHDIRVNAIAPGGILTGGVAQQMRGTTADDGKKGLKAFMSRMALGRMGKADDIARVALFLASDLSSYITGSCIVVDGGYLIS
ncbi:SDR family NAD(P)-dependent oxidoreductase [Chloroflexota bacterium]